MISLTPLIKRLQMKPAGFSGQWFRSVGGGGDYASIDPAGLPLPACWVVRAADKTRHLGERFEELTPGLDVVIAIENVRASRAGEADDELLRYRVAVKDLLLGWEIEPDVRPMRWNGGSILEYTKSDIYWRDRYEFQTLITNYLPDPPQFEAVQPIGDF